MRAKKSLGQNFLKSEKILQKIVEAGEIKNSDVILEIGPGRGALTEKLLEKAKTVVAVEKDYELVNFLTEKFQKEIKNGKLLLINDDILKFNLNEAILIFTNGLGIFSEDLSKNLKLLHYKIIANIPYNITGAILKKFLTGVMQPCLMVLMVQHEVAKRIMGRDGKESILSISVKAYGTPEAILKVDRRYFSPKPKVDSAIIKISDINREFFIKNNLNEEKFWKIVRIGFAHKRKKLGNNLKNIVPQEKLSEKTLENKRAEDLSLKDWIKLSSA